MSEPPIVVPAPRRPPCQVLVVHGHQQICALGLAGLDSPAATARRTRLDECLTAALVGGAQVALPLDRLRRGQRTERGLEDRLALDVEGQPVLERAGPGVLRLGQGDEPFPASCSSCSAPSIPYFASRAGRSIRHPLRPVLRGHGHQALQDVRLRPRRRAAAAASRPRATTAAADRTGNRPALHGLLDRGVDGLAERLRHRDHLAAPRRPGSTGRGGAPTASRSSPPARRRSRHGPSPRRPPQPARRRTAMPRSSTSPSSPASPSGPPPLGACHSTVPSAETAEQRAPRSAHGTAPGSCPSAGSPP